MESDLINEIAAAIRTPREFTGGTARNPEWTAWIKRVIGEIGRRHAYSVVPNENERQWLFDLIWFRNEKDSSQLSELGLVLESEWSTDDWHIQEDFEKLLVAKAPIKVMVFQDNGSNLEHLFGLLRNGIRVFQPRYPEETYILAAFKNKEYQFEIRIVQANEV